MKRNMKKNKKKNMKKKVAISFLVIASTLAVGKLMSTPVTNEMASAQEVEAPEYAKWGRLAMQKTMKKYPNADVIDYLHLGKEEGTTNSVEKFKLWLREDGKEFGVFVDITFSNKNDKVVDIKFTETSK